MTIHVASAATERSTSSTCRRRHRLRRSSHRTVPDVESPELESDLVFSFFLKFFLDGKNCGCPAATSSLLSWPTPPFLRAVPQTLGCFLRQTTPRQDWAGSAQGASRASEQTSQRTDKRASEQTSQRATWTSPCAYELFGA